MESDEIVLTVRITASEWRLEGKDKVRIWDGPPNPDLEQNTAARVKKIRSWPFAKFEWCVWGPFEDEEILQGEAASEILAMKEADAALKELVAGVETPESPAEQP
jgi:hypothetical protein